MTRRKRALSSFVDGLEVPGKPGEGQGSQGSQGSPGKPGRQMGCEHLPPTVRSSGSRSVCPQKRCRHLPHRPPASLPSASHLHANHFVTETNYGFYTVFRILAPPQDLCEVRPHVPEAIPKPALPTVSVLAGGAQVGRSVPSRGPAQTCTHFPPPTVPLLPPFCQELFLAQPQTPSKRQPHLSNSLLIPTCFCQRSHLPAV